MFPFTESFIERACHPPVRRSGLPVITLEWLLNEYNDAANS